MYSVTTRTPAEFSPMGSGRKVRCTSPAAAMSCSSQVADEADARPRTTGIRPATPSASVTRPSRFSIVKAGASASRCTTRNPSNDFPATMGVDIVEPRPASGSRGSKVGVTGIKPCAAMGPHTAFRVASKPAPPRVSRTPRNGRPFSGKNRSVSETCGHSIETTTARRCANSAGDSGWPRAAIAWAMARAPAGCSVELGTTTTDGVRFIVLELILIPSA
jgi:hypothetical protein